MTHTKIVIIKTIKTIKTIKNKYDWPNRIIVSTGKNKKEQINKLIRYIFFITLINNAFKQIQIKQINFNPIHFIH